MSAQSKRALERTLAPRDPAADRKVDAAELARIEDALQRVPRGQGQIFLAVRIDDLSYTEIAERTGLTAVEVERLFAAAFGNLMRNLDDPKRHWWRRWLG